MRKRWIKLTVALSLGASAAGAQVRTVDPNRALDGDLAGPSPTQRPTPQPTYPPEPADEALPAEAPPPADLAQGQADPDATTRAGETYSRNDLIAAGEGVFGKGAQGLAGIIERTLKEQGRPNAYIAGHEAAGAFVVGLRYGSGIMSHKVEGQQPIYWTGPSVGFDVGGDATKVFVLVYNLYDTEELYRRFPGGEGRLYFIGGFAATYLRRGHTVIIPIRLGVGYRAGVNVGYMKFTHHSKLLPF